MISISGIRFCRFVFFLYVTLAPLFFALNAAAIPGSEELLCISEETRPWVYWFWKNGNISSEGITSDLEAMHKAGIGGMIVMEVSLSVPGGPITFFGDEWRSLFAFAVKEADRLGLKVVINSAPGWTGSGGPWITPELSMKKVVSSETHVTGPKHVEISLAQPETLLDYYRDITVLAFPAVKGSARIEDIEEKALYVRGPFSSAPGIRPHFENRADYPAIEVGNAIDLSRTLEISDKMDDSGTLIWDVPEGDWTLMRFGYTTTGQTNRPAPLPGLECDKLDRRALESHFNAYLRKLVEDSAPYAGKTLAGTHFDSWEVGGQNWTDNFQEEFRRRRGYACTPYLPAMRGYVVTSREVSERFLWDLRQTVSEMIAEYHGRHMRDLAHALGLSLSIEPYDMTPCDDMTLGAAADLPMCEFWSNTFDTRYSMREAVSVAHVYGRPVVGAEAFTSVDKWLIHPGAIKPLGDWAFSEGVNKLVIHRYIHQPFAQARPGLSLGPHGLHYERTQTWWEYTRPWHEYLARCQNALRNTPVADLLYLSPEGVPNVFQGPEPAPEGYKYDACTPEALLNIIACDNGVLTNGKGACYRMLVLPDRETMTPALLRKVGDLAKAGAVITGPPPLKSPSLSNYPHCDQEVRDMAARFWTGERRPAERQANTIGTGMVYWGGALNTATMAAETENALAATHWIWGHETPALAAPPGRLYFRRVVRLEATDTIPNAQITLTADNGFVLFINGEKAGSSDNFTLAQTISLTDFLRPGENIIAVDVVNGGESPNPAGLAGVISIDNGNGTKTAIVTDSEWQYSNTPVENWTTDPEAGADWPKAVIAGPMGMAPWGTIGEKRVYLNIYPPSQAIKDLLKERGVPPDFMSETSLRFNHRQTPKGDLYFVSNGEDRLVESECIFRVAGGVPVLLHPEDGSSRTLPEYTHTEDGRTAVPLRFEAGESYFILFPQEPPDPSSTPENFTAHRALREIDGPWNVVFEAESGGPETPVEMVELMDWSVFEDPRIRHYSGTAVYRCDFDLFEDDLAKNNSLMIDLGRVEVVASVRLNGKEAGIAWKAPYRVPMGEAARVGKNHLEVHVANLWVNRLIGDETVPPDSERKSDGTLKKWPQWLLNGKPSPTGRISFATWRHWTAEDTLQPSGLMGPVTVLCP